MDKTTAMTLCVTGFTSTWMSVCVRTEEVGVLRTLSAAKRKEIAE